MSLLVPTRKELLDRLTILQRKIVETEVIGQYDSKALREEYEGIWEKLKEGCPAPTWELARFAVELAVVNSSIWDKVSIGQHGWANSLNRKRAELVEETKL